MCRVRSTETGHHLLELIAHSPHRWQAESGMALGPGSNNFLLGVLLATLVALGVLAYSITRGQGQ